MENITKGRAYIFRTETNEQRLPEPNPKGSEVLWWRLILDEMEVSVNAGPGMIYWNGKTSSFECPAYVPPSYLKQTWRRAFLVTAHTETLSPLGDFINDDTFIRLRIRSVKGVDSPNRPNPYSAQSWVSQSPHFEDASTSIPIPINGYRQLPHIKLHTSAIITIMPSGDQIIIEARTNGRWFYGEKKIHPALHLCNTWVSVMELPRVLADYSAYQEFEVE